jgi:hypothetical protein
VRAAALHHVQRLDELARPSLVEPIGADAATQHFESLARGA